MAESLPKVTKLTTLSALVGYFAWGHGLTALAALLPLLWALAPSRRTALIVTGAYYLMGSRAIPAAADVFFGEPTSWMTGTIIWIGASTLLSVPWAAFHGGRTAWGRAGRLLAIQLVLLLPPLGWVAWLNPILGAGLVVPGLGALSLIVGFLLMGAAAAAAPLQQRNAGAITMIGAIVLVAHSLLVPVMPPKPQGWVGARTADGQEPHGLTQEVIRYSRTEEIVLGELASSAQTQIVVLPEMYVGTWNLNAQRALKSLLERPLRDRGAVALIGTAIPIDGSSRSTNSLIIYSGHDWNQRYDARMAVPFSMWHPWKEGGTQPTFALSGTVQIGKRKALITLCFEDLLIGPHLPDLILNRPDLIVSSANGWWVRDSSAQAVQAEHIRALAQIFGLPLVRALNAN